MDSFKKFYINEMSSTVLKAYNNLNGLEIKYAVNPTKTEYMELLKDPLSVHEYDGETFYGVRIGIVGQKVYMWSNEILHAIFERTLNIKFDYKFQYDYKNYPDRFLTDSPKEFLLGSWATWKRDEELYKKYMLELTQLIRKVLYYIPAKMIMAWADKDANYHSALVDFSKYIDTSKIKNDNENIDEPKYVSDIKKFHTESVRTSSKNPIDPTIEKLGRKIAKNVSDKIYFDCYFDIYEMQNKFGFLDKVTGTTFTTDNNIQQAKQKLIDLRKKFNIKNNSDIKNN